MSNIKLLPCPCCKGEGRLMQAYGRAFTFYAVICQCGLQTKDMPSMEMAAEIWNKRQPIDDIVERLDDLEDNANTEYRAAKVGQTSRTMDYYDGLEEGYRTSKYLVKEVVNNVG